jgi:hypothetical protein
MDAMSLLTRDPRAPARERATAPPERTALGSPAFVGVLAGGQAVLAGLVFALVPVMLVWLTSARVGAHWTEAARVGADAFALAHGAPVALPSGELSLVPLGLTALVLTLCWVGGRRVHEALRALRDPVPRRDLGLALAGFVVGYSVPASAVAVVAGTSAVRPFTGHAVAGAVAVSLVGALLPMLPAWLGRWPHRDRLLSAARAGAWVLGALAAVATLLTALALWAGRERVLAVHEALHPGAAGHVGLVLLQLALLPVLAVWALSYLAGPGFTVGAGTLVQPGSTVLGPLPALPVLGGLPDPGTSTSPATALLGVLAVVACGAVGGVLLARRDPDAGWRPLAVDAAAVVLGVGLAVLLVGLAASGSAGPGRLADVGPAPWVLAGVVALEVAVGVLVGVLLAGRRVSAWVSAARARRA